MYAVFFLQEIRSILKESELGLDFFSHILIIKIKK